MTARHLEANGLPTVIIGSARDIVEHCAVPRFLFTDSPLGNPCGRPYDRATQRMILEMALDLLEHATAASTTVRAPYVWSTENTSSDEHGWRDSYMYVDEERLAELRSQGAELRAQRERDRATGFVRAGGKPP